MTRRLDDLLEKWINTFMIRNVGAITLATLQEIIIRRKYYTHLPQPRTAQCFIMLLAYTIQPA